MADLRLPEGPWSAPSSRTTKRKRQDTDLDIAVDADSQADRFDDGGNDSIDLTPLHQIPDVLGTPSHLGSAPVTARGESQPSQPSAPLPGVQSHRPSTLRQFRPTRSPASPSESKSSKESTSAPSPRSSNLPNSPATLPDAPEPENRSADNRLDKPKDESKAFEQWDPKDWDDDEFDSDDEHMSLAVMMRLANELSLLKSFLELYRKFNIHLGDLISGPRHQGFLTLISSTVARLEAHTAHLRALRAEKQRGDPAPSGMEVVADKISRKCRARGRHLRDVMQEKVDMADDAARAAWVRRKKAALGDVMGGLVGFLDELGEEEGWKGREVGKMGERWEKRWRAYGAMDREDLKSAGWILDVGK